MKKRLLYALTLSTALCAILHGNAHAYLDPGTGSYMLQIILAALLGAAFTVKMFWLRIKAFFSHLISRKPKDS
jgi:hypothetical protein